MSTEHDHITTILKELEILSKLDVLPDASLMTLEVLNEKIKFYSASRKFARQTVDNFDKLLIQLTNIRDDWIELDMLSALNSGF